LIKISGLSRSGAVVTRLGAIWGMLVVDIMWSVCNIRNTLCACDYLIRSFCSAPRF
jgi:hypothetical protein